MNLSELRPADGSKQSQNFRRGRGHGSGNGKTAGKGHKGQKARSGATRIGFEGGQMPLYRRLPKRGFHNRNTKIIVTINLDTLNKFEDGAEVTVESLVNMGIVKNPRDGVKVLGNGELTKKLDVKLNAFSASAVEKIKSLGYIDDERYARLYAEELIRTKSMGLSGIKNALMKRGIDRDIISDVCESLDFDACESIKTILASRYKRYDLYDEAHMARIIGSLQRKGYKLFEIRQAYYEYLEDYQSPQ